MGTKMRTLNEVRQIGLDALARALGPADMVRFLQQFETGKGDYTAERYEVLGNKSLDDIIAEIQQRRASKPKTDDQNSP